MSTTIPSGATPSAATPSALDLFYPDFDLEHASTRRLLARFPDSRGDWRPHEWSRTLAELATHVADIPNRGVAILTTDEMDTGERGPLVPVMTASELLALHDASVARLQAALATTDLAALSTDWVLRRGTQVLTRGPRRLLLRRVVMSHLIHHRAQLGVYFRLLGVPVPGMYGPSADDLAGRGPA